MPPQNHLAPGISSQELITRNPSAAASILKDGDFGGSEIWDDQFGGCRAQRYLNGSREMRFVVFPTSNPQHRRKLRNLQSW